MQNLQESFLVKIKQVETEREALQSSLDRVMSERDVLLRENKKMRASFLSRQENEKRANQSSLLPSEGILSAAKEALMDYQASNVDMKAEQRKNDFQSRIGSRLGSYKYAAWLKQQQN